MRWIKRIAQNPENEYVENIINPLTKEINLLTENGIKIL